MEDAVESGSKERVLTPASQRVCGLLIVAGVTAIKQSLSLPKRQTDKIRRSCQATVEHSDSSVAHTS